MDNSSSPPPSEVPYYSNETTIKTTIRAILPWVMWFCAALFYFYEFLVQVSPNPMGADFMRDFAINNAKLGWLAAAFAWAYAFMQIPAGVLLDNLGPHRVLAIASATLGLACFVFSVADNFYLAILARFCIGLGSAFAILGCLKIATNWFPPTKFALMLGLTITIGMSGAIIGEAPIAIFMKYYTWREIMGSLSLFGCVLFLLYVFVVKDYPKDPKLVTQTSTTKHEHLTLKEIILGLGKVVTKPQMWAVALYGGLMFAPTMIICALWGVPFLGTKYGFSREIASGMCSIIFWGWIVGGPTTGWISDNIQRRLPTMISGSCGALICILAILYAPSLSKLTLSILLFSFGFCSSGFLNAFSIIRENAPPSSTASALGFMNMMNSLGIALFLPIIGIILDALGTYYGVVIKNGNPEYTLNQFYIALGILPLLILAALSLLPFIKETHCKPVYK